MKRGATDEGAAGDSGVNGPRFLFALSLSGAILLSWSLVGSSIASAQSSAQTNSPTEGSGEPQKVAVPISGRGLPEFPEAFSRGIVLPHPRTAIHQSGGNYLNPLLYIPLLGLFLLWTWTCHWVDDDSKALKVRNGFWTALVRRPSSLSIGSTLRLTRPPRSWLPRRCRRLRKAVSFSGWLAGWR